MKRFTRDDVINFLKKKQGDNSLRAFATSLGITVAYLSDVYRGRRDPGPAILDPLKLKAIRKTTVFYEKAQ
jgi:hypothetical protein